MDPGEQPGVEDTPRCEIHFYNVESGTLTRITENNFAELDAAFSPDGSQLVFTSSEDGYNRLYIMDLNSRQRRLLSSDTFGYREAWSPDGQWIAFMSNHESWNDDIYIIAPDGTGLRRITTSTSMDDQPEWVS